MRPLQAGALGPISCSQDAQTPSLAEEPGQRTRGQSQDTEQSGEGWTGDLEDQVEVSSPIRQWKLERR